jgi:hypothetical protein
LVLNTGNCWMIVSAFSLVLPMARSIASFKVPFGELGN